MVTASYHDRVLGRGADYARAPITSLALHGKLWYHDNDTVSFRYDEMNAGIRIVTPLPVTGKNSASRRPSRKPSGNTGAARVRAWQRRLPELLRSAWRLLRRPGADGGDQTTQRAAGRTEEHDCSSVAEILVVSDEPSCSYATFESGFLQQTLQPAQVQLAKLGAPHDSILVDDLALTDLRYKLVLFLNCFHLSDAAARLIWRKVLNRIAPCSGVTRQACSMGGKPPSKPCKSSPVFAWHAQVTKALSGHASC